MELARTTFEGGDKLLVLLHGNSLGKDVFTPFVKSITHKYKIVLFDLPGHGDSPKSSNYSIRSFSKILAENINQISGEKYIVAHSISGHLVFNALHLLENISGITCVGSPPLVSLSDTLEAFTDIGKVMFKPEWSAVELEMIINSLSAAHKQTLESIFEKVDPGFRMALSDSSFMEGFRNEVEILNGAEIPVNLVFSSDDPYLNPSYNQFLEAKLTNSIVKLFFLDWGGHVPFVKEPERFWNLLLKNCR
ncbi:alpha/beta hydrolase [uncultured Sunxiuqinia sp.]|uniref:alpha/beta hydrolase n=1 Tax=uncultured Sunxiuqinia sp. TaxID=1573825 RepID=UPI002AA78481|nr:alpha/beta hydrolase [uncultured Sunxiuqinia sp.]